MIASQAPPLSALFETDETAWLERMAELVRRGRVEDLDLPNLSEFLSDMARRDRREVESRLRVLITHRLKWEYQPARRSRSWLVTIEQQRQELVGLLTSGTLHNHAEAVLPATYANGLRMAALETGLPVETFPAECEYKLAELTQELAVGDLPE
jgi:hypothetical protein